MPLAPGHRFGPYEIVAPLGAGGMGEVYRATDTRLNRTVAIKVLPAHLAGSAEARARFEREARAVSALSHPNICTLHDVGREGDLDFLVMEHLEGETLHARLAGGALPLDEVLRLAVPIADALAAAHRHGVVHRDLKPGNVMLTRGGPKLLDFGLAKGMGPGSATDLTATPTMTSPLTAAGTIIGTFQYMAPEQLEGKEADARTDLWAFGLILYEMATGRKAFEGRTQASLIASVLKDEPRPLTEVQALASAGLERVVRRCLAKDPEERWQSALDLKAALEWLAAERRTPSGSAPAAALPSPTSRTSRLPLGAALGASALVAAAAFGLGWLLHRPAVTLVPTIRSNVILPVGTRLDTDNAAIALSPDGSVLAYAGGSDNGPPKLWLRRLDSFTADPIAGTEGASYPFWSPDGRTLGFFGERKLKKVPAGGGTVQSICNAEEGRGASWGSGGVIVFAPSPFGGLMQVAASGGTPSPVTSVDVPERTHRNPRFLPDGKRLLFYSGLKTGAKGNGIYLLDLESKQTRLVQASESEGIYLEPGYVAFVRDENLLALPVDPGTLEPRGEPVPIAENVQANSFRATGTYSFSNTGLMLYQTGSVLPKGQLTWFDLDGNQLGTVGEPAMFWFGGDLSPDGRRAAVTLRRPGGGSDVWIYELARGVGSRFTFGGPAFSGAWSPDGSEIAYADEQGTILLKRSDGTSEPRKAWVEPIRGGYVLDWSPDGAWILFSIQAAATGNDVLLLPVNHDGKARPLTATAADELFGCFSPDGRWAAYQSDESGRPEIYVVPFPGPGGKWQVSSSGGAGPLWLADGRELAFTTPEGSMVAVALNGAGGNLEIGAPRPLFGGRTPPFTTASVMTDGKRILCAVPVSEESAPALTLVTNWWNALGN